MVVTLRVMSDISPCLCLMFPKLYVGFLAMKKQLSSIKLFGCFITEILWNGRAFACTFRFLYIVTTHHAVKCVTVKNSTCRLSKWKYS